MGLKTVGDEETDGRDSKVIEEGLRDIRGEVDVLCQEEEELDGAGWGRDRLCDGGETEEEAFEGLPSEAACVVVEEGVDEGSSGSADGCM